MSKMEMQIDIIDITDIKPYQHNSKEHPREQIEQIMKSIEEFGMNDPIGVWGKDNEIVEGHGRYLACTELGIAQVPVIHLDWMSDEQRRAYNMVHNKLTMNSDFDTKMMRLELDKIIDIDMSEYGFDLDDIYEKNKKEAKRTQDMVENIVNLGKGEYYGVGDYDIPLLEPVKKLPPIKEWISFNYVLSDPDPTGKAVHFFIDDYQFERVWNNPEKYADKLSQYVCVATPDFSPYGDMPLALQIYNVYRKNWVGAFLQEHGCTVIPTIRASTDPRSMDFYLDGVPEDGIVIISSMWTSKERQKQIFMDEYNTMMETVKPRKVFLYGMPVEGLEGNVEFVPITTVRRDKKTQ